jgi:hypothetical protein
MVMIGKLIFTNRLSKKIKYFFFLFFVIVAFIQLQPKAILESRSIDNLTKLSNGDIILRKEQNYISDLFAFVGHSDYSHVGTIFIKNKEVFVVHIELNEEKKDLKIVSLKSFLHNASSYQFYRSKHKVDDKIFNRYIESLKALDPEFDLDFLANENDNKIYCTELAYMINKKSSQFDIKPVLSSYLNYKFIPIKVFENPKYFIKIK